MHAVRSARGVVISGEDYSPANIPEEQDGRLGRVEGQRHHPKSTPM